MELYLIFSTWKMFADYSCVDLIYNWKIMVAIWPSVGIMFEISRLMFLYNCGILYPNFQSDVVFVNLFSLWFVYLPIRVQHKLFRTWNNAGWTCARRAMFLLISSVKTKTRSNSTSASGSSKTSVSSLRKLWRYIHDAWWCPSYGPKKSIQNFYTFDCNKQKATNDSTYMKLQFLI